jgi:hypothetical protein
MDDTGVGSLKLVVVTDATAGETLLRAISGDDGLHRVGPIAWVVHTVMDPAAIRDRLAAGAGDGATVFVAEFERWSAFGEDIDTAWLLRRGH